MEQENQIFFSTLVAFLVILVSMVSFRRVVRTGLGRLYVDYVLVPRSNLISSKSKKNDDDEGNITTNDDTIEEDRTVSSLFIHPVKSLRPVDVASVRIDSRGIEGDRGLMLVTPLPLPLGQDAFDPNEPTHRFLTQRQVPRLATVVAKITTQNNETDGDEKGTVITFSSHCLLGESVTVSTKSRTTAAETTESEAKKKEYRARLWDDVVRVEDMGDEAASFFSQLIESDVSNLPDEFKGINVRLVIQSTQCLRSTDEKFTPPSTRRLQLPTSLKNPSVSLTDGFPILIATEASLAELNRRIKQKNKPEIPMSRFRPNIVVKGDTMEPFEEDNWKVISIDGVIFHIVKGCPRCKQSCVDQVNGDVYDEPLATLREFRIMSPEKLPDDLFFAQNVIPAAGMEGRTISVGASVKVLKWGKPVWG